MRYLPLFIDVANRPCLVVGGGDIAEKKVRFLLRASAQITVLAPSLCPALESIARAGRILHLAEDFTPAHVDGYRLVIAAVDDDARMREISAASRAAGILVNVVDRPSLCSFVVPALVDREPVLVAISTGGAAPVLGRMLRQRVESLLPGNFGRLAALAGELRSTVRRAIADPALRQRLWEGAFSGPVADLVFAGREDDARIAMREAVVAAQRGAATSGEICLIGVCPGAEDLLNLRALRAMQGADVVMHGQTISPVVMDLTRRDAERCAEDETTDASNTDLMCRSLADTGKRVLRILDVRHDDVRAVAARLALASGGRYPVRVAQCIETGDGGAEFETKSRYRIRTTDPRTATAI